MLLKGEREKLAFEQHGINKFTGGYTASRPTLLGQETPFASRPLSVPLTEELGASVMVCTFLSRPAVQAPVFGVDLLLDLDSGYFT